MFGKGKKPTASEVNEATKSAAEGTQDEPVATANEVPDDVQLVKQGDGVAVETAEHRLTHDDASRINQHLEPPYVAAGDAVTCMVGEHGRLWYRVNRDVVLELGRV